VSCFFGYPCRAGGAGARPRVGPPTRARVTPRRQQVRLQATPAPNPEVDKVDWDRRGGTLGPEWAYVGSAANATTLFLDDYPDNGLVNEPPAEDDFQPWPTQALPREGIVRTAGSAVEWVSGDEFDPRWAPRGTLIRINGIPYTLYQQPTSTFLQLLECAGAQEEGTFEIPRARTCGATLPTLWGPFEGFYFAVGDPPNPGQLNWSKGNDPDMTSEANSLYLTIPS